MIKHIAPIVCGIVDIEDKDESNKKITFHIVRAPGSKNVSTSWLAQINIGFIRKNCVVAYLLFIAPLMFLCCVKIVRIRE